MKFPILICVMAAAVVQAAAAGDDPFNSSRVSAAGSVDAGENPFNKSRANDFNDYRANLNAEYARQIREYEWSRHNLNQGLQRPQFENKPVEPVVWNDGGTLPDNEREIGYNDIVRPIRGQASKPIAPVAVPDEDKYAATNLDIVFLGSTVSLRTPPAKFTVGSTSATAVADAWNRLSNQSYARLVADCITYKGRLGLCDWAYLVFLENVAKATSSNDDSAAAMMTYLASQSGYRVRLATTREGKLDMMFASQHLIFEKNFIVADGIKYYPYLTSSPAYNLCQSHFNSENGISLWINALPKVEMSVSADRAIKSRKYPDFAITTSVNKNLISFYSAYPSSCIGENMLTRWAMYANTPVSSHIRNNLYPQLRRLISGLSPVEAVQRILNLIQTGLTYEYDDKVWGGDRAFFPEESLYYPYCDCEDRSILLTRIVRDLLGLKCLLVYYPGHLAAAVNFQNDVAGDYIVYSGNRYTIADPTYINAPLGSTMPKMDNSIAKIILLDP